MNPEHEKAFTVARIYFQSNLNDEAASAYAKQRGLSPAALRAFEIGYAPNQWRGLVDHFSSHKIRMAAHDAGLFTTAAQSKRLLDFFRDRLMFPIRDHHGSVVGYGGRKLNSESESPKYINTPETEFFNKSEILFGLHQNREAIAESGKAVLVEGYMDVVALHSAGIRHGVAPMGTAITPSQIGLLLDHGVKTLWLCLDADDAGLRAAERTVEVIMEQYTPELEVRIMALPDKHDPDSYVRAHGRDAFESLMSEAESLPAFIHRVCMADMGSGGRLSLEDKAEYAVKIKPFLDNASGALKSMLIDQAAVVTGLPREVMVEHMGGSDTDDLLREWDPNVLTIARALTHKQADGVVARFLDSPLIEHGLDVLQGLQDHLSGGETDAQINTMMRFALAHGPLSDFDHIAVKRAEQWLTRRELQNNLETLRSMPFDSQARDGIRTALGMR